MMKKILSMVAVVAASLVLAAQAHAQFGIIAGLTSSKTDMSSAVKDVQSIALYHAGITSKINLGLGFAVQPSLIYQVKGAAISEIKETTSEQLKTGYVEVPVALQWGPDLLAFRPYVFAEPFVGYQVMSSYKGDNSVGEWIDKEKDKLEYGLGLGAGLEVASHIQLSVQWFKNLGKMFGEDATSSSAAWEAAKDMNNFQGIKVSLALLF